MVGRGGGLGITWRVRRAAGQCLTPGGRGDGRGDRGLQGHHLVMEKLQEDLPGARGGGGGWGGGRGMTGRG